MAHISKTELNNIFQLIESLSAKEGTLAIELYNQNGIVSESEFPFMRVVYEYAKKELCQKLEKIGFIGTPNITGGYIELVGNCYAIYNPEIYYEREAFEWLKETFIKADCDQ